MSPNVGLIDRTLAHIEAHQDEWNQGTWGRRTECGTTYCFAGHAIVLSGYQLAFEPNGDGTFYADYVADYIADAEPVAGA